MEAKELDFSYGSHPFIKNMNVKIEKGVITTILGPNGSGKSTLLNLFVNQLVPEQGELYLDGVLMKTIKTKELAKKLAIVYQQNTAPQDLTVEQLVGYGRTPYQSLFGQNEESEEIIAWALNVTGLEAMRHKRISALSGGERQRAWIAMALAQKTDILFLDEPTTYLDIYYQVEVLELVKMLNEKYNITIIMVLHDINQALQYSHNVIIMKKGSVIYEGPARKGITEERIREVYGISARIAMCPDSNCPYLIPIHTIAKNIKGNHI